MKNRKAFNKIQHDLTFAYIYWKYGGDPFATKYKL